MSKTITLGWQYLGSILFVHGGSGNAYGRSPSIKMRSSCVFYLSANPSNASKWEQRVTAHEEGAGKKGISQQKIYSTGIAIKRNDVS